MSILSTDKVKLNAAVNDKFEAVRLAGELLVNAGHADPSYVESMVEREQSLSTYMGGGLAIPHGTNESKGSIKSTGLSIVQIPAGVDFGEGNIAHLVIGIAAVGDDHLDILTNVAMVCSDDDNLERILKASTAEEMIEIFESGME
ncbi:MULTISPECIES: PTS sugar transporter subunit IIA [unclassified Paenibacillus]|uniref:PTS sugar transporter subunit IIA n=1 Tax=unclassified Paenibacillus TaxID=185978 RepID=UPI0010448C68|nr:MULTISPECIES: PTS sugar transporter subunit IIA [unclassified Paenibacillus]NIK71409.1 PTS system mannitol-specific IIA component [Paenibacillus sp. BK720]TCM96874.1 PTS system D-mannitol-specific IIA component (Fru family) [Paenibacillus sp. BK033]